MKNNFSARTGLTLLHTTPSFSMKTGKFRLTGGGEVITNIAFDQMWPRNARLSRVERPITETMHSVSPYALIPHSKISDIACALISRDHSLPYFHGIRSIYYSASRPNFLTRYLLRLQALYLGPEVQTIYTISRMTTGDVWLKCLVRQRSHTTSANAR